MQVSQRSPDGAKRTPGRFIRQILDGNAGGGQRVESRYRRPPSGQSDKAIGHAPPHVLACLCLQTAVERIGSAGESGAIMGRARRRDAEGLWHQEEMTGAPQCVIRFRRTEDGGGQRLLILEREPEHLRFLDGAPHGPLRRRHDEVA